MQCHYKKTASVVEKHQRLNTARASSGSGKDNVSIDRLGKVTFFIL